ncbi:MAG: lytic transglycosylase domain-containing protein [Granulosicoccus sp.]|nr:lytic transglycosylase domain-containing protein [Granulosicoccus sp.]
MKCEHKRQAARLAGVLNVALVSMALSSIPATLSANVVPSDTDAYAHLVDERDRFRQALDALSAGKLKKFEALRSSLQGYPLQEYLEFARLQRMWSTGKPGSDDIALLNEFEKRTADASLTRRLTRTLQKRFADTGQWRTFLALGKSRLAAGMPCETLQAHSAVGLLDGFDEASIAMWVKPVRHRTACQSILSNLESRHTPTVPAIWERIFQSMEQNKPEFVTPMLGYLASRDRKLVKRWIDAGKAPQQFLTSGALDENTVLNRRIVADLVVDWSREDTQAAMKHWLRVRDRYSFYEDRYYDTHRALAMRAAYRRMPEAHGWLNEFTARADDLELKEWRIRTALWAEDWESVHRSIADLPLQEQVEDHWAYWEARALEKLGRLEEANGIYSELAGLQSYYGFLAADRLQLEYSIYDQPIAPDPDLMATLSDTPELIRSREFHYVELTNESRREWNNWLKGRQADEISAAAVLASEWGLHDRAIYTAGISEHKRAISLRFPVLYRTEVAKASAQNSIEPAWIFGVMRRESAYIRDIRSRAGAVGLMQLMPRTAKYVAKLQGNKNWRGDLTDSATNIDFGTYYLRHVMNRFDDHQVLATASYNAGPHRVDKWLRNDMVDADVWIDSIPYTETRRYVRAVMAYSAIYEYNLTGQAQRLSTKLRPIPAASGA